MRQQAKECFDFVLCVGKGFENASFLLQALLKLTGRESPPKPRYAVFGKLQDPETEYVIDHALTLWFPGRAYLIDNVAIPAYVKPKTDP